eukprot:792149_1
MKNSATATCKSIKQFVQYESVVDVDSGETLKEMRRVSEPRARPDEHNGPSWALPSNSGDPDDPKVDFLDSPPLSPTSLAARYGRGYSMLCQSATAGEAGRTWSPGDGLGRDGSGIRGVVAARGQINSRIGLGFESLPRAEENLRVCVTWESDDEDDMYSIIQPARQLPGRALYAEEGDENDARELLNDPTCEQVIKLLEEAPVPRPPTPIPVYDSDDGSDPEWDKPVPAKRASKHRPSSPSLGPPPEQPLDTALPIFRRHPDWALSAEFVSALTEACPKFGVRARRWIERWIERMMEEEARAQAISGSSHAVVICLDSDSSDDDGSVKMPDSPELILPLVELSPERIDISKDSETQSSETAENILTSDTQMDIASSPTIIETRPHSEIQPAIIEKKTPAVEIIPKLEKSTRRINGFPTDTVSDSNTSLGRTNKSKVNSNRSKKRKSSGSSHNKSRVTSNRNVKPKRVPNISPVSVHGRYIKSESSPDHSSMPLRRFDKRKTFIRTPRTMKGISRRSDKSTTRSRKCEATPSHSKKSKISSKRNDDCKSESSGFSGRIDISKPASIVRKPDKSKAISNRKTTSKVNSTPSRPKSKVMPKSYPFHRPKPKSISSRPTNSDADTRQSCKPRNPVNVSRTSQFISSPSDKSEIGSRHSSNSETLSNQSINSEISSHHSSKSGTSSNRASKSQNASRHCEKSKTVPNRSPKSETASRHSNHSKKVSNRSSKSETAARHSSHSKTVSNRASKSETDSRHSGKSKTVSNRPLKSGVSSHHFSNSKTVSNHSLKSDTLSGHSIHSKTISKRSSKSDTTSPHSNHSKTIPKRASKSKSVSDSHSNSPISSGWSSKSSSSSCSSESRSRSCSTASCSDNNSQSCGSDSSSSHSSLLHSGSENYKNRDRVFSSSGSSSPEIASRKSTPKTKSSVKSSKLKRKRQPRSRTDHAKRPRGKSRTPRCNMPLSHSGRPLRGHKRTPTRFHGGQVRLLSRMQVPSRFYRTNRRRNINGVMCNYAGVITSRPGDRGLRRTIVKREPGLTLSRMLELEQVAERGSKKGRDFRRNKPSRIER